MSIYMKSVLHTTYSTHLIYASYTYQQIPSFVCEYTHHEAPKIVESGSQQVALVLDTERTKTEYWLISSSSRNMSLRPK